MAEHKRMETDNVLDKKAQQLMEDRDAESRTRVFEGTLNKVFTVVLVIWAIFQVWANTFGTLGAVKLRTAHIMFLLPLALMLYPTYKKERRRRRMIPAWDVLLIAAAIASFGYILWRYDALAKTGRLNDTDVLVGVVCLLIVFEAARRASGNLAIIALIFLSYFAVWGRYVPGMFGTSAFTLKRVIKALVWDTNGILGTGAGVSATYIFVFVLFGSFLKHSGFSQLINDVALTLVGRSPGGPAKVAVIASALMGMINGSAIANVATTGTITIPLMKKTGYKKDFAAAVEAVASTGGQFTPPIMGAVGFVMAEFMAVSYMKVMLAAAIPAFLYYLALIYSVHLEARRLGLSGLSPENIPKAGKVLRERGHLLIPLIVLLALMFMGYTPLFAAIAAIFVTIPVSWLRKETRMNPSTILKATVEGSRSAIGVGVSCIIIGVIIGSVNMTSLGLNFGNLILKVVGEGQLFLGGLMVMVMSTILGMGVPGVAAYVIVYVVAVPVLRATGATEMAANMFCLIYACLSNITPPVAMSSYVAAGIADSNMTKTSLIAMKLGVAGFILPFFFLNNPVLLYGSTEGVALTETLRAFATSSVGVLALAAGLAGLPLAKYSRAATALRVICRAMLLAGGLLFVNPTLTTDIAGLVLIAAEVVLDRLVLSRAQPIAEAA
ncbi:MAG: TRAP transporter fused permease subunit [Clostridiales bacterium]|nr:TRAP transporter fused permease subunit [Clostridiales bacterium]MCI7704718.1 TRAP transporter fused permease subunit [Clostridiales bacterium]MDY3762658.1 TRAP transporter fused permease subunit [Candidatus Ventricola sp.]MDY4542000.1 TRAP transporter fused permease subunit [Candidatus Ventricola sp.]MDY4854896.1 TRAP transporter fused permease subunit [Candidatus Ventricola sp.]